MKQPMSPCKGCTFETGRCIEPNCHDTCERFIEYKRAHESWKAPIKERKSAENFADQIFYTRNARFQNVRKKRREK
jgi:hypothetical protein